MDLTATDSPLFKSMDPPEPLHQNQRLRWDHPVNLIGEKVVDPLIHCCDQCDLPVLLYGRMIPCKHVFCLDCANKAWKTTKKCPRCQDVAQRIDQSALGTVFVCTHGSSKHCKSACRKTYLSPRDLQAHIDHRHLKKPSESSSKAVPNIPVDPRTANLGADPYATPDAIRQQQAVMAAQMMAGHMAAVAAAQSGQSMAGASHMAATSQNPGTQQPMMSPQLAMMSSKAMISPQLPTPGMMPPNFPQTFPPNAAIPPPTTGAGRTNLITIPIEGDKAAAYASMYPGMSSAHFPYAMPPYTAMPPRMPQVRQQQPSRPPGQPPTPQNYQQPTTGQNYQQSTSGQNYQQQPSAPPNRFSSPQNMYDDHSNTPPYQQQCNPRPPWPPRGPNPRGPPPGQHGAPPGQHGQSTHGPSGGHGPPNQQNQHGSNQHRPTNPRGPPPRPRGGHRPRGPYY